jgi:BMFP domain-containing protein YqiC
MITSELALALCAAYTAYKADRTNIDEFKKVGPLIRENYSTWDLCSRDTELWDPLMALWASWKVSRRKRLKGWILSECIFPGRYPDSTSFKTRQAFDLKEAYHNGMWAVMSTTMVSARKHITRLGEALAQEKARSADLEARIVALEAAAAATKSAMQAAMQAASQ